MFFIKEFKFRQLRNFLKKQQSEGLYYEEKAYVIQWAYFSHYTDDKQLFDYYSIMIQLQIQQNHIIVKPYRKCWVDECHLYYIFITCL